MKKNNFNQSIQKLKSVLNICHNNNKYYAVFIYILLF